jgi:putative transposase
MAHTLKRKGYEITEKKARRYMKVLGLEAIYPKRKAPYMRHNNKIYPYLLEGLDIIRPGQVWATDITYIPILNGFVYLVVIMDWYSRAILSWRLSNSLCVEFCIEALEEALTNYIHPEIFNSDQGSQFTSNSFTEVLIDKRIDISMDGRGRAFDNIMIERLWRTIKYENIYLNEYRTINESKDGLRKYIDFYNHKRLHSALAYKTPLEVYNSSC